MNRSKARTEGQRRDQWEERIAIFDRQNGICAYCGHLLDINDFEIAHRIMNGKWCIEKYGLEVIDHPLNKAATHRGRCNSGMLITYSPVKVNNLIEQIKTQMKLEILDKT
jgi:hypothetical protein